MTDNKVRRESFVFYRSFHESLKHLSMPLRNKLREAIENYVFDGVEPDFTGDARGMWELIKPNLDACTRRYDEACQTKEKAKENGRKCGNPNFAKGKPNVYLAQKKNAVGN